MEYVGFPHNGRWGNFVSTVLSLIEAHEPLSHALLDLYDYGTGSQLSLSLSILEAYSEDFNTT